MTARRDIAPRVPIAFGVLWLAWNLAVAVFDLRIVTQDYARVLLKALELVDLGIVPLDSNPVLGPLRLGPLSVYLSAIPLLFSRSLSAQYTFFAVFNGLGVLVFYMAMEALGRRRTFRWAATILFAFSTLVLLAVVENSTNRGIPFFLACYLFCLIQAMSGQRMFVVLTWILVGLCMQLHLACFVLGISTLYALNPFRNFRDMALNVLGMLAALLTHIGVLFALAARLAEPVSPAAAPSMLSLPASKSVGALVVSYLGNVVEGLTFLPALAASPLLFLLAAAGVFRLRRLSDTSAVHYRLLKTSVVHWGASAGLYAFLFLFKDRTQVEYFQSFVVFGAVLAASFFADWWERRGEDRPTLGRARTIAVGSILVILLIGTDLMMAYRVTTTCSYKPMFRANAWTRIAEQTDDYIRERDLKGVSVRQHTYTVNPSGEVVTSVYDYHIPTAMLLLRDPRLYPRLVRDDTFAPQMYIRIVPQPLCERAAAALTPESSDPLAASFDAGCMRVTLTGDGRMAPILPQPPSE
ncbi:MAG: hypothetical protein H6685_02445 [Deltaproteobacteria bacterium]|nr:hypothetical protein [Deltaproteobacteria bacterium]